ncbi:hypothetical protein [Brucella anthropi]|uniref:hypothetical protein n=1 Tax=Brucella anthropi TaxID=529 RepID=UPI00178C2DFD|nr:hypothetical protein [Brucella anthropi]MDG9792475.1 hypothetical protein [Brucella anthropi]MDH0582347.1 hypothetical protein [Brucella anthropi]MDH0819301.1 hypothetical protein [Brucella anthropi]MDH2086443.1 hypothetical protein [Brucella anthropi]
MSQPLCALVLPPGGSDFAHDRRNFLRAASAKHELCAARSKMDGSRATYAASGARHCDDLVLQRHVHSP